MTDRDSWIRIYRDYNLVPRVSYFTTPDPWSEQGEALSRSGHVSLRIWEIIAYFLQYIKSIQHTENNRRQHEAPGNKPHKLCNYSPKPRAEVYCFRLNFNISKLVYFEKLLKGRAA